MTLSKKEFEMQFDQCDWPMYLTFILYKYSAVAIKIASATKTNP